MLRTTIAAGLCLALASAPMAEPVCVVCAKPDATYRCSFEKPAGAEKLPLGDLAQDHVCEKVLALAKSHKRCRAIADMTEPCEGPWHTVTVGDYQRLTAQADSGEVTYEPGLIKRTQRGMQATWDCVASLFGDC
jgi:hypothetical protein